MKKKIVTIALFVIYASLTLGQTTEKQAYVAKYNLLMRAKGGAQAERLFQELLNEFGDYRAKLPNANKDVPLQAVAGAFILDRDTVKANQYIAQLSDKPTIPAKLYGFARDAQKANLNQYAEHLFQKTILAYESSDVKPDPKADPLGMANNREKYGILFYTEYAQQLRNNGKVKLAMETAKKAYMLNKNNKSAIHTYGNLLAANKMFVQALPILEEGIRLGAADTALLANYKQAYNTVRGEKGYQKQLALLEGQQQQNVLKEVEKQLITVVAPDFSLKDLNGKTWSLNELKGKTVILDFWATWCAPCKKSFPAMQLAVNKYKDDKSVVFLFIHTWERDDNAAESAARYIKENNYNFSVLMDLKTNGQNEAITAYKASGIPAKFVIDGKGVIRFKLTGFAGTNEAAVSELSAMIELAKKNS